MRLSKVKRFEAKQTRLNNWSCSDNPGHRCGNRLSCFPDDHKTNDGPTFRNNRISQSLESMTNQTTTTSTSSVASTVTITPCDPRPLDILGSTVPSLLDAQSYLNLSSVNASTALTEPTYLPDGLSLMQIRAQNGSVNFVYNGTGVSLLNCVYYPSPSMLVTILQDGSKYSSAKKHNQRIGRCGLDY